MKVDPLLEVVMPSLSAVRCVDNMTMADELLEIAEKDLEASDLLWKKGLYPQSVFYFQQSVEKLNKAFGLKSNKVTVDMLQNEIGHKPLNIHVSILKEQKKSFENYKKFVEEKILNETDFLKKKDVNKHLKEINNFISETKALKNDPIKYANLQKEDLQQNLDFLKELCEQLKNVNPEEINVTEQACDELKTDLLSMFSGTKRKYRAQFKSLETAINELEPAKMEELLRVVVKIYVIMIYPYCSCLILSFIMQPHASLSRYPKGDFSPDVFYTKELPLVELLPTLINIQRKAIEGFKEFQKCVEEQAKKSPKNVTSKGSAQ